MGVAFAEGGAALEDGPAAAAADETCSLAASGRLSDSGGAWPAAARERESERKRACVAARVLFAGGEWKTEPGGWRTAGDRCLEFARTMGLIEGCFLAAEVLVSDSVAGLEGALLMVEEVLVVVALAGAEGGLPRLGGGQIGPEEGGGSGRIWQFGTLATEASGSRVAEGCCGGPDSSLRLDRLLRAERLERALPGTGACALSWDGGSAGRTGRAILGGPCRFRFRRG